MMIVADPDRITHEDLRSLIDSQATESQVLEFKSRPYESDHEGSREFLKDASAFANTNGGLIIIGIEEKEGIANSLLPIDVDIVDKVKLRLHSLLQNAIEPRIFGVRIGSVKLPEGFALAIRVPRSSSGPHRVTAKNSNRFYLRSSSGVYEASYGEVRSMFIESASAREKIIEFRDKRIQMIRSRAGFLPLVDNDDKIVLHMIPLSAFLMGNEIDMSDIVEREALLKPLGSSSYTPEFNFDGFVAIRGGSVCYGYTQLFRDGCIEATKVNYISQVGKFSVINAREVEEIVVSSIVMYSRLLCELNVPPPIYVILSLLGVRGSVVNCRVGDYTDSGDVRPIMIENLLFPPCIIESFGEYSQYQKAITPALNALWNVGGFSNWSPDR